MDTKHALKALDLSDKQIKCYEALLSLGRSSAPAIANKSSLKRTTAYTVLDELASLGLVTTIDTSVQKTYRPLSPHLLVKRQKDKLTQAEKAVPEIEAQLSANGLQERPHVKFFEGVDGIKQIVNYKLEELEGGTLREMLLSVDEDTLAQFDDFFEKYDKKLQKLNISERGISPDTPEIVSINEQYKKAGQDIAIVDPDMWSSSVAIEVGKSWVKMYDLKNLQGIIIQNPAIAQAMRQMFDMSYKTAIEDL